MNNFVTIDTCAVIHLMYITRFYLLKALGYSVLTTIYVQLEFEQGKPDSLIFYNSLVKTGEITLFSLEIEDLVEMSNIPQSKRASEAELSCFVVARRIGSRVMTDVERAIRYIQQYISMPPGSVIQLVEFLIEAYLANHLGDHELKLIQKKLEDNQYKLKIDLANEAARRRWMTGSFNQ